MSKLIVPQWPLPKGVAACSSTRIGGVSLPPYDSLNLGAHCGDNPDHVEENRKRLFAAGNLPSKPVWLEQVHGKDVLKLTGEPYASKRADASYSNTPGTVCAVMTADCLPVLFGTLMAACAILIVACRYLEGVASHAGAYQLLASMRIHLFKTIRKLAPACLMDRTKGDILNGRPVCTHHPQ